MTRNNVWSLPLILGGLCLLLPDSSQALPTAATPRIQGGVEAGVLVAKRGRKKKGTKTTPAPEEATPPPAPPPPPAASSSGDDDDAGGGPIMSSRRGPARVDFDDRLIQGQSNKSGAIYIFERKSSELRSMVRRRTTFRDEIIRSID